jgi:hypothetical protein
MPRRCGYSRSQLRIRSDGVGLRFRAFGASLIYCMVVFCA